MKTLFIILFLLLASSPAIADEIFVDRINEYWAYVCLEINERWTCKDVHAGALERDYGISNCTEHGWFDVPASVRVEK